MRILILCLISLMLTAWQAQAEIRVSGYGSIAAGKVISGDLDPSGEVEFQVDFYDYAYYVEEWDWEQESMVALQLSTDISDKMTATMQLVAKGADAWQPDIDWLYVSYKLSENGTLMLGRRMLLENPATYLRFAQSTIPETEFLAEVARRSGYRSPSALTAALRRTLNP